MKPNFFDGFDFVYKYDPNNKLKPKLKDKNYQNFENCETTNFNKENENSIEYDLNIFENEKKYDGLIFPSIDVNSCTYKNNFKTESIPFQFNVHNEKYPYNKEINNDLKIFVEFFKEILPYLRQLNYLKNLYKKLLEELIQEKLKNYSYESNDIDKFQLENIIIIKNMFYMFYKISRCQNFITSLDILYIISEYLIQITDENNNLAEKLGFNPDHPKDFEKEAEKMIQMHDIYDNNKLCFLEYLNIFGFKNEHLELNDPNIDMNLNKEFFIIDNENLNYIMIKFLCDSLIFYNFFLKKLNYLLNNSNWEIFEVFLELDKKNNNFFSLDDLKNFLYCYYTICNDVGCNNKTDKIFDSDIELFFNFLNVNKEIMVISVLQFEKTFSINRNFRDDYKIIKSLEKSNTFKNLEKKTFTNIINSPKYSKKIGIEIILENQNISNNQINIELLNEKLFFFKEYLTICIDAEETLEKIRYRLAYKSYFNPYILYLYLTNDLSNDQINKSFRIPQNQLSLDINQNSNKFFDQADLKNCNSNFMIDARLIFIRKINERLKNLEIFLTDREIDLFCSAFNFNSLDIFINLFITNFENARQIIIERIKRNISDPINQKKNFSEIFFDEETKFDLIRFFEKFVFYEDKKEYYRKKLKVISYNYIDLFHHLDIGEKGYLLEKDFSFHISKNFIEADSHIIYSIYKNFLKSKITYETIDILNKPEIYVSYEEFFDEIYPKLSY